MHDKACHETCLATRAVACACVCKGQQGDLFHVAVIERRERRTVLKRAGEALEQIESSVGLLQRLNPQVSHILLHFVRNKASLRWGAMAQEVCFPARLLRAVSSSYVQFSSCFFRLVLVSGRNSLVSINSDMERVAELLPDGLIRTRLKTKVLPDLYRPTLNRLYISAEIF